MERHWFSSIVKALPVDRKQRGVSDITRPDEVEMNSIGIVERSPRRQAVGSNPTSPIIFVASAPGRASESRMRGDRVPSKELHDDFG